MSEKDFVRNADVSGTGAASITHKKRYGLRNFILCDPRHFIHRFIMLGFMCFLSFGKCIYIICTRYIYDILLYILCII